MQLLLQIFAPFESSVYDRWLVLLICMACLRAKKSTSVRALRVLKRHERLYERYLKKQAKQTGEKVKSVPSQNKMGLGQSIFASMTTSNGHAESSDQHKTDENASGQDGAESEQSEGYDSDLEADVKVDEAMTALSLGGNAFESQYIATCSEPAFDPKTTANVKDITAMNGVDDQEFADLEETVLEGVDDVFKKFTERMEREPSQCLRYDLNGQPLFYTKDQIYAQLTTNGKLDPPMKCVCGAKMVFEYQAMPSLVSLCKLGESKTVFIGKSRREQVLEMLDAPSESFGTIIVLTCEKDCRGTEGFPETYYMHQKTFIQWETD